MSTSRAILLAASLAAAPIPARAQCEAWSPVFGAFGVDQSVLAMTVHDDGTGPALYCGGNFDRFGDVLSHRVGRWDGTIWSVLGPGLPGDVHALASFDDGGGAELYAGGAFFPGGLVSRWDGSSWTSSGAGLDPSGLVLAFEVFDDGTGSALYAGGIFPTVNGVPAGHVAKWNGAGWSPLGAGIGGNAVQDLVVYDDGTGAALYAVGDFATAGGVTVDHVAKWDGTSWSAVGGGVSGTIGPGFPTRVFGATVFDDGSGPKLVVAGDFTGAGGAPADRVATWDGASWSGLDLGSIGGNAYSLGTFDPGTGEQLLLGGEFVLPAGAGYPSLLRRSGAGWVAPLPMVDGLPRAMTAFDPGNGTVLFVGGSITGTAEFVGSGFVLWDGQDVGPVDWGPNTEGLVGTALCLGAAPGPELLVGGTLSQAGNLSTLGLASWDGSQWSDPDLGEPVVTAIETLDLGSGPVVFASGEDYIARRAAGSSTWTFEHPFSGGGEAFAFAAFDSGAGPQAYAGGAFNWGGLAGIAKFDGVAWQPVGGGVSGAVNALAVYDDGGGPDLYAGGTFVAAGGIPGASYLARWDGSSWTPVGTGVDGIVHALLVYDDGTGPKLCAAGNFTHAGGLPADRIARWNGTTWSPLGAGFDDRVRALAYWDDGGGPALYAAGHFTHSGAQTVTRLARWYGSAWSEVGGGANANVLALEPFDDGSGGGPDLYLAGAFTGVDGVFSHQIARRRRCDAPGIPMCFGDGSLATPCPCANFGAPGHGCENSATTGGAVLGSTGTTSPDTVVLFATGERPTALTIFLQGAQITNGGIVFGDGLRCASGTLKRLYTKNAVGGAVAAPVSGEPSITARSAALGDPIAPGGRRYYQTYYRDPVLSFCPAPAGNTFNSSNAVKIVW